MERQFGLQSREPPTQKFYPIGGYEVPIAILLEVDNQPVLIQNSTTDSKPNHKVILRLGTRVSEKHPSVIGFRAMLRTKNPKLQPVDSMEESYHVISYEFKATDNMMSHRQTSAANRTILEEAYPSVAALSRDLYEMHFQMQTGFQIASYGQLADTSDPTIEKTLRELEMIKRVPSRMALYFPQNQIIVSSIENIIAAGYKGIRGLLWSDVSNYPNLNILQKETT